MTPAAAIDYETPAAVLAAKEGDPLDGSPMIVVATEDDFAAAVREMTELSLDYPDLWAVIAARIAHPGEAMTETALRIGVSSMTVRRRLELAAELAPNLRRLAR